MRCPTCDRTFDDGDAVCPTCRVLLEPDDDGIARAATARLGIFHPEIAGRVTELLMRRAIEHRLIMRDDDAEVLVDATQRDDLRTQLALNWTEVIGVLDDDVRGALIAAAPDGAPPGWHDAPRGGHIDRSGRLVVDTGDDEVRTIGPAMAVSGLILAIVGWFAMDSGLVATVGLALAVGGALTPR